MPKREKSVKVAYAPSIRTPACARLMIRMTP